MKTNTHHVTVHNVSVTESSSIEAHGVQNPYLADILAQPDALERFLGQWATLKSSIDFAGLQGRPRVLLAGMGSSHYATFPLWRGLIQAGIPAWWMEAGHLLDDIESLAEPETLVWLTSQSGDSGEVVKILDLLPSSVDVVGVTNMSDSSLGRRATVRLDLVAGPEATVSTKSYVNSVALSRLIAAELAGDDRAEMTLRNTVSAIADYLCAFDHHLESVADFGSGRNILLTGRGEAAVSAQEGSLIIKEASKQSVEGLSAGALRHGVIELAGPSLTVAFFDHDSQPHRQQNVQLAADLAARGTEIGWVGSQAPEGCVLLPGPSRVGTDQLICDALTFQTMSYAFAQRNGVTPGSFLVASKVTETL